METRYDQIQAGWSAHDREGDKIGDIEELGQDYLLVTKGLIFTKDLYIPQSAIQEVDTEQGQVWLNVAKSEVDSMGWDQPPTTDGDALAAGGVAGGGSAVMDNNVTRGDTGGAIDSAGYGGSTADDASYAASSSTGSAGYVGQSTDADLGSTTSGYDTTTSSDTATTGDTLRVPVHEEELRAARTTETAGEVQVGKSVVEEERTLDVPVTREEVEVRRVPAEGSVGADADAFTGDTIRVPVSAETVDVSKEARVVEEIEISKRPVTETQRVSETVRREQVNVDDASNVTTGATGTGQQLGDETLERRDDDRSRH